MAGAQTPDIDGSLTAEIEDSNGDGAANPAERINYDLRLRNSGDDATNVEVEAPGDPNTTFDGAMVGPIGINDDYTVTGNISISVPAAAGVLINDLDPDGGASPVLVVSSADTVSSEGGQVNVNPDGSFTYIPPAGFSGTDTFEYEVRDAQNLVGLSKGVVSLDVAAPVWFIDDQDSTVDDASAGTLANPFNSISAFNARNTGAAGSPGDGDVIFIFTGSGTVSGTVALRPSQTLLGQGVALTSSTLGFAPAPYAVALPGSSASPTITGSGTAIQLASNNTVRGLRVGDTPTDAYAISGANFGTLILSDFSASGTGGILNLSNGNLNATSNIAQLESTDCVIGISLDSVGGAGLTVASGTHISSFSESAITLVDSTVPTALGVLDIATTTGTTTPGSAALRVSNSSSVSSTGGAINSADAVAIDIDNAGINLVFESVRVDGADRGIDLDTTTGSFSVIGDTTAAPNGSGGTLANLSGDGIVLSNAENISVEQLDMTNVAGSAVIGRNGSSNLAFRYGTYAVNTGTPAIGLHAIDFGNSGPGLASVTGTLEIEGIVLSDFCDTGLLVNNESGSLVVTVDGETSFSNNSGVFGRFGINAESRGSAEMVLNARNSSFSLIESSAIRFEHDSSAPSRFVVNACTTEDGGGSDDSSGGGIAAVASGSGDFDIRIDDNELQRFSGSGIVIDGALGSSQTLTAEIGTAALGNRIIGQHGTAFSLGDGIAVQKDSGGDWDIRIVNNTIDVVDSTSRLDRGIYVRSRDNPATLNVEIRENTIADCDNEGFRLFTDDDLPGTARPTTNLTLTENQFDSGSIGSATIFARARDLVTLCANIFDNQNTENSGMTINLDADTTPGQTVNIVQGDPRVVAPNLGTSNPSPSGTPANVTITGTINFEQFPCALPTLQILP